MASINSCDLAKWIKFPRTGPKNPGNPGIPGRMAMVMALRVSVLIHFSKENFFSSEMPFFSLELGPSPEYWNSDFFATLQQKLAWDASFRYFEPVPYKRDKSKETFIHHRRCEEPTGLNQAERVIRKFGGAARLCLILKALGKPRALSTIYRWGYPDEAGGLGGLIPHTALPDVLAAARVEGIVLSSEDLDPRHEGFNRNYHAFPEVHRTDMDEWEELLK